MNFSLFLLLSKNNTIYCCSKVIEEYMTMFDNQNNLEEENCELFDNLSSLVRSSKTNANNDMNKKGILVISDEVLELLNSNWISQIFQLINTSNDGDTNKYDYKVVIGSKNILRLISRFKSIIKEDVKQKQIKQVELLWIWLEQLQVYNILGNRMINYSKELESGNQKLVIVIGSGAREHAIACKLAESNEINSVVVVTGNGGTMTNTSRTNTTSKAIYGKIRNEQCQLMKGDRFKEFKDLVGQLNPSLIFVGPEQPLVDGLVDEMQSLGITCFGPNAASAILEGSKAWSKDFMKRHNIKTASYKSFTNEDDALKYLDTIPNQQQLVVKASGLAAGKGVIIPKHRNETESAVKSILSDHVFGKDAGAEVVIEEFLNGEEISILAFCDGKRSVLMPSVQDHKRIGEADTGLNTGGMGAYAPAPLTERHPDLLAEMAKIVQMTVDGMASEGRPYIGVLYTGFIVVEENLRPIPYVLEYNCRLGDPETQVLLPLLHSDLYQIACCCCRGDLYPTDVLWKDGCAATVVCAAAGYPNAYEKGTLIKFCEVEDDNTIVYHAGTNYTATKQSGGEGDLITSGGRVFSITGVGPTLRTAFRNAYKALQNKNPIVSFKGMYYRRDIGYRALHLPTRIGILGSTRGTDLTAVAESVNNGILQGKVEIVVCISNKSKSGILDRAKNLGINTVHIPARKNESRSLYDAKVTEELARNNVELILCIGWMRIFSKEFTDRWKDCCMNVHPSLLPEFAGGMDMNVHQLVIDSEKTETGCTIHMVTDKLDGGPIIIQRKCAVLSTDDASTLKARVQQLEGEAFIEAILMWKNADIGPMKGLGWYSIKTDTRRNISYKDAGVDIDAGEELVRRIKPFCKRTNRSGCVSQIGNFGGLFDLSAANFGAPGEYLVAGADGVGTKLKIAIEVGIHDTVGIDLVAMNTNDILTCGAEPLFFLDYYATGSLDVDSAVDVIKGISEGCVQSGCALIGGETAEMSGMYAPGEYDLGGFAVGIVRKNLVLPRIDNMKEGDMVLALSSSGVHSNGFSLVRKCVEASGLTWTDECPWDKSLSLGKNLLQPTKIYVKSLLPLIKNQLVLGCAHITGGGIVDNLPRCLPATLCAEIDLSNSTWKLPKVFQWLQRIANLPQDELCRTFNCGVGMILIVDTANVEIVSKLLSDVGEVPMTVGRLILRQNDDSDQVKIIGQFQEDV